MAKPESYVGIDKDINGGMTAIGKIVRDAWVFGLIPETQTCEGWSLAAINSLMHQVDAEWDKYGCMVSRLPEELFERHQRIHQAALLRAKEAGWSGDTETDKDH